MADLLNSSASPNGNANPRPNGNTNLGSLPSLCRGLYNRVAQKLGCDPSYVSRVARGDRSSQAVSEALQAEIQKIDAKHRTRKNGSPKGGLKIRRGRA